jgi:hypothetical protein
MSLRGWYTMMDGIIGIAVNIVGKELLMNDYMYSYYLNKKMHSKPTLDIFNYLCEDCNSAFVTDVPWNKKCDNCHDNYFKDFDEREN